MVEFGTVSTANTIESPCDWKEQRSTGLMGQRFARTVVMVYGDCTWGSVKVVT